MRAAESLIARAALFLAFILPGGASSSLADEPPILCVDPGGHTSSVTGMAFTADGRSLVSVGYDKVARIWNLDTGQQRAIRFQTRVGPYPSLTAVALSPDSNDPVLAVGEYDPDRPADILLFRLNTGEQIGRLSGFKSFVTALAFSPDGRRLAAGGNDGIRLWDVTGRSVLWYHAVGSGRDFEGKAPIRCVAFSPGDGSRVAGGADDGSVHVWQTDGGREVAQTDVSRVTRNLAPEEKPVRGMTWASSGYIFFGSRDQYWYRWKGETGVIPDYSPRLPDRIECLAVDREGRYLICGGGERPGSPDTRVHIFTVEDGREAGTFDGHRLTVWAAAISPDGKTAATADASGATYVWDIASRQIIAPPPGHGQPPTRMTAVMWSNSALVGWGGDPGKPPEIAFDLQTGLPSTQNTPEGWTSAWHAWNDRRLIPETGNTGVRVTDAAGKEICAVPLFQSGDRVHEFTFAPDGRVIVASDVGIAEYDVSGRKAERLRIFEGHNGAVLAVAVSPDGRYLASTSVDQTVRVWDLRQPGRTVAPMLNLFVADNGEWIAWVNEGYYNASPLGDRYIGWQVNQGPDRAALFYDADRFSKLFYRPDVLYYLFRQGSTRAALQAANAELVRAGQDTQSRDISQQIAALVAPDVEIASPAAGQRFREQEIRVQARMVGPNQVGATLHLLLADTATPRAVQEAAPDMKVTLRPGRNVLRVYAVSNLGVRGIPAERIVYYDPPAPRPRYRTLYMLAIGIGDYPGNGLDKLTYARDDAKAVADLYQKQKGALFENVVIRPLYDPDATRSRILQELQALCAQATRDDYVVVFISGHGVTSYRLFKNESNPATTSAPLSADDYKYYLASIDFVNTPEQWDNSGVNWDDILKPLTQLQCPAVLMVDTCHSSGAAINVMRGSNIVNEMIRGSLDRGLYVLASCLPSETSKEYGDWQHGAFTKALLEVPEKARRDPDGIVPFRYAEMFIWERVRELVGHLSPPEKQTPRAYVPPDAADDLPLLRVNSAQK
jgi:WD40 repeat protein